jgi:hypothetical protein
VTSTALVSLPAERCPFCRMPLLSLTYDQPALLRHGGYGGTLRTTLRYCPACPFTRKADRMEVRPR